jgi:hypothetical protein
LILTGVTIEFHTHDDDKNANTTLNIQKQFARGDGSPAPP